jgi:hypothetical protein
VNYRKLDVEMKKLGFKIVKFPSGHSYNEWYVRTKLPYTTQISKVALLEICDIMRSE